MKNNIKKAAAALLTSIILCAGTSSVVSAGTVSPNTPHNHGQFTYLSTTHTYEKYETVIPYLKYKLVKYEERTYRCRACDGKVNTVKTVISSKELWFWQV